jgi:hypothetical protein
LTAYDYAVLHREKWQGVGDHTCLIMHRTKGIMALEELTLLIEMYGSLAILKLGYLAF